MAETSVVDIETLENAAAQGKVATLEQLLEENSHVMYDRYTSHYEIQDAFSNILCAAAGHGRSEVIEFLITKGANINIANSYADTALTMAAVGGDIAAVRFLLDAGADVNVRGYDGSILHRIDTIETGIPLDTWSAIIDMLLDAGLDIEIQGQWSEPPLHSAAYKGDMDMASLLIARGANVHALCENGTTPLDQACEAGSLAIVKLLVSHGAEINTQSGSCHGLDSAVRHGDLDLVTFLLDNGANAMPRRRYPPELYFAASCGHLKVFELLLNRGFRSQSRRSLYYAIILHSIGAVTMLVNHGVAVDVVNSRRRTLLHMAVLGKKFERKQVGDTFEINPHDELIMYLVRKGVDVDARDIEGKTAVDYANELGYTDVWQLIKAGWVILPDVL